jgi:hypothetical protein
MSGGIRMEDQDKLLKEALAWEPKAGQRVRPERYWRAIMEMPWEQKEEDDKKAIGR